MKALKLGKKVSLLFTIICLITATFYITPVGAALGNVTGVTVSGDTLTISIGSDKMIVQIVKPEIMKVDYQPGGSTSSDTLVLDPNKTWGTGNTLSINTTSNPMVVTTSKMVVKINKTPCRISVYDASGSNLLIKEQDAGGVYNDGVNFTHNTGETFYGISGFDAWQDSYVGMVRNNGGNVNAGGQGWAGAPLAFTSKYGVLVDSDGGDFTINTTELKYSNVSKTDIEFYILVGTPKVIIQGVAEISGKPAMFPKWAMGFMNTEWGTDQNETTNIINTYRSKAIPIDCFILDFDWKAWGEDNYGEWRWNSTSGAGNVHPNKYPDGASGVFASNMAAQGLKLGGITKPRLILQNTNGTPTMAAQYATDHGFWFSWQQPYNEYFSNRPAKDLDFSVASCRSWYWTHFQDAFDKGIIAWWNDEADYMNNFQFLNMQRALYEGQRGYSNKRVWSINRNFFLGSQRYAYGLWSGDINTGFDSMANQRERMLSSINTGGVKWGMDSGGFGGHPSSENYARWLQFSAVVPIFRVHGTMNEQRQPWVYGITAEAAAKNAAYLRYRLIPYIYSYERVAYETGLGIVRPLFYEFLNDCSVVDYKDAWMFGDYLLAAPVVTQGQTVKNIYLPAGTWYDYTRGTVYAGPQMIQYSLNSATWEDLPLFIKKGAIIPKQETQNYLGERTITKVYLEVFPDTVQSSLTYYDDDGQTYNYETGSYFKQTMTAQDNGAGGYSFNIGTKSGSYSPSLQSYICKIHGKAGTSVTVNGGGVTKYADKNALENASGEGWATGTDVYGDVTYVKVSAGSGKNIVVNGSGAPDKTIYDAEEAILQEAASINKDHLGYTGAGFVDGYWNQNATTKFNVRVPSAGNYSVNLRYANATGGTKTVSIYVNGAKIRQTSLGNLANWDTWSDKAETLSLNAGLNTIAYKYDSGDSGNINLDYIYLTVGNISQTPLAPMYYRIKNRWTGEYLHIENRTGKVECANVPSYYLSSQWLMAEREGYKRFVNRWTGEAMHLENLLGYVQCGNAPDYYHSSQWTLEDYDGYKRIRNRWQPDNYIHIENRLGYAQYGNVPGGYWSNQWTLESIY